MTVAGWAILLISLGAALLVAEILLPTHGILGILGGVVILAAISVCFSISMRLGLTALIATLIATPLVAAWAIRVWPKTPVGRRLVLTDVNPTPVPQARALRIGQRGVAVSALRPSGEVDFGALRLEAISEQGIIEPGRHVVVVSVVNKRPTVRLATDAGPPDKNIGADIG